MAKPACVLRQLFSSVTAFILLAFAVSPLRQRWCFIHFPHPLESLVQCLRTVYIEFVQDGIKGAPSYIETAMRGIHCLQGRNCAHKWSPSCAENWGDRPLTWCLKVSTSSLYKCLLPVGINPFNLEVSTLRKTGFKELNYTSVQTVKLQLSFKQT